MGMRSFTIYDLFERNALTRPGTDAIVCGTRRLTFLDLKQKVDALAAGLSDAGIEKGDRVAILAHNCHRFFYIFGAAAALGAIVVPINWRLAAEEIGHILDDCEPKLLFVDTAYRQTVKTIASLGNHTGRIFSIGNSEKDMPGMDALMASGSFSLQSVSDDDPFCLIYTAAVEGRPRGATLSHANLVAANIQTAATMGISGQDTVLDMLPLFHITGLNLALALMQVGGKNVVTEKFEETEVLRLAGEEKITVMGSFPPILSRLVAQVEAGASLAGLRHVIGIDAPETITAFEEKTGAVFWVLYGQTETSGMVSLSPFSQRPGSAGQPGLMVKVRIVDEYEREVAPGATGEIVVQGPLIFHGFWKQEALNRKTFRENWHHTGDLGRLDDDGYLFFSGRKPEKELIKPGGENVYPAEVEKVILEHPEVIDVSVIGVPDPKFGEGIKAVCVLQPGSSLSAQALIDFVAGRIARYKKPGYVSFVDSLPKTDTGAIDRKQVKALYGA